jgi:hypothetical protein
MSIFIQIGTNNGNDKFRSLVIKHKPQRIILIEPNQSLYETICKNYKGIPNVTILNRAIYYNDNTLVDLYIGAKNKEYGSKSDNGVVYSDAQFSLVPMNDWGDKSDMVKITANSICFDTLCSILDVTKIDYLQIDTEGFDTEIINMIDFTKYTIHQIRFEKWEFSPEEFTKHNESIASKLGVMGMYNIVNKLMELDYRLTEIADEDGNDIVAHHKSLEEVTAFYKVT